jgi:hypothetical protein
MPLFFEFLRGFPTAFAGDHSLSTSPIYVKMDIYHLYIHKESPILQIMSRLIIAFQLKPCRILNKYRNAFVAPLNCRFVT